MMGGGEQGSLQMGGGVLPCGLKMQLVRGESRAQEPWIGLTCQSVRPRLRTGENVLQSGHRERN